MSLPPALRRALDARRLLLALDFDGTLVRLRRDRAAVRLPDRRRALLRALSRASGVSLLIVSGRSLADLRRVCRGTDAALAGDHGLRLEGLGPAWRHPRLRAWSRRARALGAEARAATRRVPGVRLELKEAAVAVHYRLSSSVRRDPRRIRLALSGLRLDGWRVAPGKCVWELRPRAGWGKGEAIALAARRAGAGTRVLFIGDDATDEEGFARLRGRAATVRVGRGRTAARFRVLGIAGVDGLLREALRARR